MNGSRKYGAHRHSLQMIGSGAGAAADLYGNIFTYDAYAEGGSGAGSPGPGYDSASEALVEFVVTMVSALVGQATNFASFRVVHRNAAAGLVNTIRVDFNAAGVVTVAAVPLNLAVASGALVPGAGTGVLTVVAGTALPWTLTAGDTIMLDRVSTGAGQATPSMTATMLICQKGS